MAAAEAIGRTEGRQRDLPEGPPPRRPEHASRLLGARIEALPEAADRAHDDGEVEEGVGEQDRPRAALEVQPDGALRAEEREERRAHHHRGQHERHDDERLDDPAAAELVAGQHLGRGQGDHQRERRRGRRLPEREPGHLPQLGVAEHVTHAGQVPPAVAAQALTDDVDHGPHEEHGQERRRRGEQRRRGPPSDQRSTRSVHRSIHSSRCAPMSAGGSSYTSVGPSRVLDEQLGQLDVTSHREHEHRQRHVGLHLLAEEEVDQLSRRGLVVGAGQDPGALDLAVAARVDHAHRRLVDGRVGVEHLGGRARRVGHHQRAGALARPAAGERRVVRLLPPVDDLHAVGPQIAPPRLPAVLAEGLDAGQQEGETRRRGRRVLHHEEVLVQRGRRGRRGWRARARPARRTRPCRSSGTRRRSRSA